MIKIGTSGFQFPDWKGTVYPAKIQPQKMLSYYETILNFNTVEINYTFYTLPLQKTMIGLLNKTTDSFDFVVRSHKEMTHDIWHDKKRTLLKNTSEVFMKFMFGIRPLIAEGRLGCVLIQFPYFFYPNKSHYDYLLMCKQNLKDIPLVIEFRNRAWLTEQTLSFLKKYDLGFCIVDEPPIQNLMPTVYKTTSAIGYFRLHGRNPHWFGSTKDERYNYNYSPEELKTFTIHIKQLKKQVNQLYVFFNNCYSGHAAQNAHIMKELLENK